MTPDDFRRELSEIEKKATRAGGAGKEVKAP